MVAPQADQSSTFELIEFSLKRRLANGDEIIGRYGINVAKVREVVRLPKINPLATTIAGVAGIFELRGVAIPAIHLCKVLGDSDCKISSEQLVIVSEFSQRRAGFIVDQTHRIRRVAWSSVQPPAADEHSTMTGMILIEDNEFLFILDLERIIGNLEKSAGQENNLFKDLAADGAPFFVNGRSPVILVVDDSSLIQDGMRAVLQKNGFEVLTAGDGQLALATLKDRKRALPDLVITDVEMPQMDGLSLLGAIRGDEDLKSLPVLLHSSLSGQSTIDKALAAGADGYIVKNDIQNLLSTIRSLLPHDQLTAEAAV